jgi:hypothetical protein
MNKFSESFNHRKGSPLERNMLYDVVNQKWPLFFQGYELKQEGDYKKPVAVFWDFMGNPYSFNKEQVALSVIPTTSEQFNKHLHSAKSLVDWLLTKQSRVLTSAQSQPKCTTPNSPSPFDEEGYEQNPLFPNGSPKS